MNRGIDINMDINITKDIADSANYDSRIKSIVLHYTNLPERQSLEILKQSGVSVHF